MSFLGRLFGRPTPVPPPAPPANSVVVPEDLVAALTAGGRSLSDAVVAALREHLAARTPGTAAPASEAGIPAPEAPAATPPAPPAPPGDRVPFWLAREEREPAIEDALRGKLERRRAAEGERAKGQPADAPED